LLHLQVLLVLVDDAVMPELPEVEQARKLFARCCVGRRVVNCRVEQDFKVFEGVAPDDFAKHLVGQRITGAGRKGKQLWVELEKRPWPLIHLGMSGSFAAIDSAGAIHTAHYVNSKVDASSWPPKFWKFHLQMDDGGRGTVLIFSTPRVALPEPLRAGSPPRCSDGVQVN
jgi:formamidopyrimidine-DNA glycosylase